MTPQRRCWQAALALTQPPTHVLNGGRRRRGLDQQAARQARQLSSSSSSSSGYGLGCWALRPQRQLMKQQHGRSRPAAALASLCGCQEGLRPLRKATAALHHAGLHWHHELLDGEPVNHPILAGMFTQGRRSVGRVFKAGSAVVHFRDVSWSHATQKYAAAASVCLSKMEGAPHGWRATRAPATPQNALLVR
jgi:hypothetical protein